jgi:predicted NBD/HSP70 family sugar kinase
VAQTAWPTPDSPEAFVRELAEKVVLLRRSHPQVSVEGMGVSLPGRVDQSGTIIFAPNLGWPPVSLRDMLEAAIGLPVTLENAANACALAELWFGRHPDHVRNLVAVTVSEGIGVGLLLNGQLVHGANAMTGEFGHVTLDENGPLCRCGRRGCWERYASNSAAIQYYTGESTAHPAGPNANGSERHSLPSAMVPQFEDLLRLADSGDVRAVDAIERMARFLGMGLAAIVNGLAPEVIVIIGEVTGAWTRVGPIVTEIVQQRTLPHAATRIVPTDRATQPRLRGAITLVVQEHFGAPNVA